MKHLAKITLITILVSFSGQSAFAQEAPPAAEPAVETPAPAATPTATTPDAPAPVAEPAAEPAPAPSAEPEKVSALEPVVAESASPALSRVMTHVIELMATLLMVLMTALIGKATSYFTKKTKIEIPAKTEEMLASWGGKAVNYASEKAHQYNAEKGELMKGPDKLEVALGFGLSLAEEHGMADLAKEKLTKYIEAHLGEKRSSPMLTAVATDTE